MIDVQSNTHVHLDTDQAVVLTIDDINSVVRFSVDFARAKSVKSAAANLEELRKILRVRKCKLGIRDETASENEFALVAEGEHTGVIETPTVDISVPAKAEVTYYNDIGQGDAHSFFTVLTSHGEIGDRQNSVISIVIPQLYSKIHELHVRANERSGVQLTDREHQVMNWLIRGKDNWSICKILGIAERTIKFHNCNIYRKLGVTTKHEAICKYYSLYDES